MREQNSFNFSSSWKAQNNQSMFSFARQEESRNHSLDIEPSYNSGINQLSYAQNGELYLDRLGNGYGIPQHNSEQYDGFGLSHSVSSSNKLRSQISTPPGFSVPNRPPPGFSSHVRSDQTFGIKSGNHFLESTSSLRIPYQATPSGNSISIADIEFIDPVILAVGKGRPPNSLGNSNINIGPFFSAQTSNLKMILDCRVNKMVINHLDKLFVTNDPEPIVNELEVQHPTAKLLVLSGKAQQEEIGDGANLTISFAGDN
ncbi:hypothetical protein V2J09_012871 [Rumex salicifolius]